MFAVQPAPRKMEILYVTNHLTYKLDEIEREGGVGRMSDVFDRIYAWEYPAEYEQELKSGKMVPYMDKSWISKAKEWVWTFPGDDVVRLYIVGVELGMTRVWDIESRWICFGSFLTEPLARCSYMEYSASLREMAEQVQNI